MKTTRLFSGIFISLILMPLSCDPFKQYEVLDAELSASVADVVIPAEGGHPSQITIKSNRSWSAAVPEDAAWLSLSSDEYLNLEKIESENVLSLSAEDNTEREVRRTVIRITGESGVVEIAVTQSALVPRLNVSGAEALADVVADAADYTLSVDSNVDWAVAVEEGATADISLDAVAGHGAEVVKVTVAENISSDEVKTAKIIFTAEDCDPVVVPLVQRKAAAYVRFIDAVDGVVSIEEGVDAGAIAIKTNSSWTAVLEEVDGFNNPVLEETSGTQDATQVTIHMASYSVCFGRNATMKLKFTLEDGTVESVKVSQKPVLRAKFGSFLDNAFKGATEQEWPLSSPSLSVLPTTKDTTSPFYCQEGDLVLKVGYTIKIFSNAGIWVGNSTGLNGFGSHPVDKNICSYLVFPAIEGVKLTKVVYHAAASSTKKLSLSIRDANRESVVPGGELKVIGTEGVSRPLLEWTLTGTEVNTAYSLHQANTGNMYLGDLILYYE